MNRRIREPYVLPESEKFRDKMVINYYITEDKYKGCILSIITH